MILNNYPTNCPFTVSDVQQQNPNINRMTLYQRMRKSIRQGQIISIGVVSQGRGRPLCVYATVPISSKVAEISKQMGIRNVETSTVKSVNVNTTQSTKKVYPQGQLNEIQQQFLERAFSPEMIKKIMQRSKQEIDNIISASEYTKGFRTALKSDMFSSLFGSVVADIIRKEIGCKVETSENDDNKPDLYFPEIDLSVEIKAMTGTSWQGGQYSNRPYPTLLVSRTHDNNLFWVGLVPEVEWGSNMDKGKRRYATTCSWAWVRDNPYLKILMGSISTVNENGRKVKGNMQMEKI